MRSLCGIDEGGNNCDDSKSDDNESSDKGDDDGDSCDQWFIIVIW